MSKKVLYCLLSTLFVAAMGACKKDNATGSTGPVYDKNYYGREAFIIALSGSYLNFDSALKYTGYIDTLAGPGPHTTFLTDNNAVGGWGANGFPKNIGFLLRSLIVPGDNVLGSLPFARNQRLTTLAGNHLYVSKFPAGTDSATYLVNGVPLYTTDIATTNGHIDVIDTKMPNLEQYSSILAYVNSSQDLTFLSIALARTGLDKLLADTTKSWTLLAPADAGFKASTDPSINTYDSILVADTAKLARIIRYHILGDRYFYAEFTQSLAAAGGDTTTITPILAGATPIKFFNTNQWPLYGDYFIGPGNWDNTTTPPTIHPATIYQPVYGSPLQDFITVNGVVHEIDHVLLP